MAKMFWYYLDENGLHSELVSCTLIDDQNEVNFLIAIKSDKIKVKHRRGCDNAWGRAYWFPINHKAHLNYQINNEIHKIVYNGEILTLDGNVV